MATAGHWWNGVYGRGRLDINLRERAPGRWEVELNAYVRRDDVLGQYWDFATEDEARLYIADLLDDQEATTGDRGWIDFRADVDLVTGQLRPSARPGVG